MEGIDIISMDELCKTINYSGYYLFPDNMEKVLIELIPTKYSKTNELHYCWSHFEPCHRLELKIRPTNEFYLKMEECLFNTKDMFFLRLMLIVLQKID